MFIGDENYSMPRQNRIKHNYNYVLLYLNRFINKTAVSYVILAPQLRGGTLSVEACWLYYNLPRDGDHNCGGKLAGQLVQWNRAIMRINVVIRTVCHLVNRQFSCRACISDKSVLTLFIANCKEHGFNANLHNIWNVLKRGNLCCFDGVILFIVKVGHDSSLSIVQESPLKLGGKGVGEGWSDETFF